MQNNNYIFLRKSKNCGESPVDTRWIIKLNTCNETKKNGYTNISNTLKVVAHGSTLRFCDRGYHRAAASRMGNFAFIAVASRVAMATQSSAALA